MNSRSIAIFLAFQFPVGWFNSVDPLASIVCVPFLLALWRWQAAHGGEPGEMTKIATGAFHLRGRQLVLAAR